MLEIEFFDHSTHNVEKNELIFHQFLKLFRSPRNFDFNSLNLSTRFNLFFVVFFVSIFSK